MCLAELDLDHHAYMKLIFLAGSQRYCSNTNELSITVDRCSISFFISQLPFSNTVFSTVSVFIHSQSSKVNVFIIIYVYYNVISQEKAVYFCRSLLKGRSWS